MNGDAAGLMSELRAPGNVNVMYRAVGDRLCRLALRNAIELTEHWPIGKRTHLNQQSFVTVVVTVTAA